MRHARATDMSLALLGKNGICAWLRDIRIFIDAILNSPAEVDTLR